MDTTENDAPDILAGLISECEYAKQRGVGRRLLQLERQRRTGPPFIKIGSKVFYRIEAIKKWLLDQETGTAPRRGKRAA